MHLQQATVVANQTISANYFQLDLAAPQIAAAAQPGQFVMLEAIPGLEPFLKRPFGLNSFDPTTGQIRLICQVLGRGTALLRDCAIGDRLELLGPLGRGWRPAAGRRHLLVAGGAGAAPLLPLARQLAAQGQSCTVILGARTAAELLCREDFAAVAALQLATDDGSCGYHGLVTGLLPAEPAYDAVYCCGPGPMMAAVAAWAAKQSIPCQVSLEERMGCGYGVCVGCAVATTAKHGQTGETIYQRVCREGPVFASGEVLL